MPPYGCCGLGPIDLMRFVKNPSSRPPASTKRALCIWPTWPCTCSTTCWTSPRGRWRANAGRRRTKRRIGLGFTGLSDALVMLNLRYDAREGRDAARRIAQALRDAAYAASCELARERGASPRFDADLYLSRNTFSSRLPQALRARIRADGVRNSHLLSIAPTGTISLAFSDNASKTASSPRTHGVLRGASARPVAAPRNTSSKTKRCGCIASAWGQRRRSGRPSLGKV